MYYYTSGMMCDITIYLHYKYIVENVLLPPFEHKDWSKL